MSRFARKHQSKDNLQIAASSSDEEDDQIGAPTGPVPVARSAFDMLLGDDDDSPECSGDNDDNILNSNATPDDVDTDPGAKQPSVTLDTKPSSGKKKRARRKKKNTEQSEHITQEGEDEIDASLREVNALLGECPAPVYDTAITSTYRDGKALLAMEKKNFNPDVELRRVFGSSFVQNERPQNPRRDRRRAAIKQTNLAQYKDSWPPLQKNGLTMNLVSKEGDVCYFAIEHKKEYQQAQIAFWNAVDTMEAQSISNNVRIHPYHIDTLLQLSDICKMNDDMQMAADLVERVLYAYESILHPLFKITLGTCRLDYKRQENRSLFIALFRHLTVLGNRLCYRTSLEFCKLLYSLDPESDPLCVLLMIDYYALRSGQHKYLVRLHHELQSDKSLSSLPNFAFSVPLALFNMSQKDAEISIAPANLMLQNSLLHFPGMLMPLLDKCNVEPDKTVAEHAFFGTPTQLSQPTPLKQLIDLYTCRNFPCWKEAGVLDWLMENVKEVLRRVDSGEPLAEQYKKRNELSYKKTPRNILRHLLMSDIQGFSVRLPEEISSFTQYDPLPPLDSTMSYSRPVRQTRAGQSSGLFSGFLQSMLPGYNPEEVVEGAAGGDGGADIRPQVQTLMDAMRQLLNNMQHVPEPEPQDEEGGNLPEEWD